MKNYLVQNLNFAELESRFRFLVPFIEKFKISSNLNASMDVSQSQS